MQCPNKEKNLDMCGCTYSCAKKGMCCECLHYHRKKGEIPGCFFPADAEKKYDRSIEYFIEVYQKK